MTLKWGSCAVLVICLAMLAGCRTPQPNLKPAKTRENLVEPPQEARYDTPGYPKAAFSPLEDPNKRAFDDKTTPGVSAQRGGGVPGGGPGGIR